MRQFLQSLNDWCLYIVFAWALLMLAIVGILNLAIWTLKWLTRRKELRRAARDKANDKEST